MNTDKRIQFLRIVVFLYAILLIMPQMIIVAQEEHLSIFNYSPSWRSDGKWTCWSNGEYMLPLFLNDQVFSYLDQREIEISALKTEYDWVQRQEKVRGKLMDIVGPFPEKTPLKPRITGIIQKDGFRIEKVIFESMPEFYVTSCLFIPDGISNKRPALILIPGHGINSFSGSPVNRNMIYNLVKKGFIVFAIDPIGQGERVQYTDEQKRILMGGTGPVFEHAYVANQMFLSGVSSARYFIWDCIRSVDYLLTRTEVDPDRLGAFGCSGGGVQVTYLAAFDERIKAAVPGCWISGYRWLLNSIGPQDAEQNFFRGISSGISQEDLLEVRAPKPLLISSTTRDVFPIQGAMETYEEVKKAYQAFSKEENIVHAIDDAGHGFNGNIGEIYEFFQRTLDLPGNSLEEDGTINPEDLHITETGQVLTSLGGETAFSLNRKDTEKLLIEINQSRRQMNAHLSKVAMKAVELSGYILPCEEVETVFRGRYLREGYTVEMHAVKGEGDYVIPLLLMIPEGDQTKSGLIYIHPEGKAADASPGGRIENLVKLGFIVAVPDVLGTGETAITSTYPGRPGIHGILADRSIVGLQAGDIVRIVFFLQGRTEVNQDEIYALAFGEMCPALMHASAFEPRISKTILIDSPISYREIVNNRLYEYSLTFSWGVAGALTAYDLPDLAGVIAPRKLLLAGLRSYNKEPATQSLIDHELSFPRKVYSSMKASYNLSVMDHVSEEDFHIVVSSWLR